MTTTYETRVDEMLEGAPDAYGGDEWLGDMPSFYYEHVTPEDGAHALVQAFGVCQRNGQFTPREWMYAFGEVLREHRWTTHFFRVALEDAVTQSTDEDVQWLTRVIVTETANACYDYTPTPLSVTFDVAIGRLPRFVLQMIVGASVTSAEASAGAPTDTSSEFTHGLLTGIAAKLPEEHCDELLGYLARSSAFTRRALVGRAIEAAFPNSIHRGVFCEEFHSQFRAATVLGTRCRPKPLSVYYEIVLGAIADIRMTNAFIDVLSTTDDQLFR